MPEYVCVYPGAPLYILASKSTVMWELICDKYHVTISHGKPDNKHINNKYNPVLYENKATWTRTYDHVLCIQCMTLLLNEIYQGETTQTIIQFALINRSHNTHMHQLVNLYTFTQRLYPTQSTLQCAQCTLHVTTQTHLQLPWYSWGILDEHRILAYIHCLKPLSNS